MGHWHCSASVGRAVCARALVERLGAEETTAGSFATADAVLAAVRTQTIECLAKEPDLAADDLVLDWSAFDAYAKQDGAQRAKQQDSLDAAMRAWKDWHAKLVAID